eukprot:scaffold6.g2555.t1
MEVEKEIFGEAATEDELPEEFQAMTAEDVGRRTRLLENEIRVLRDESNRLSHERAGLAERIKENIEKIKLNNQLPYLVGNIVEVLEVDPEEEEEEDGAVGYQDMSKKGKCVVLKTSTRQTVFLPVAGLVDPAQLKPADLVGVNKDSYLILDTLPPEYDSRVKAMEVDEKPSEDYSDIGKEGRGNSVRCMALVAGAGSRRAGAAERRPAPLPARLPARLPTRPLSPACGLDKQIQELREAIVLPITHKDRFLKLGIRPPKGVLLHGPPGTGKTLIARACAAQTNATFLKLAGPSLVQMFIGDGAKMVRDAFALAKEKAPAIIFIDEIDAIGTTRRDSEMTGDREARRGPTRSRAHGQRRAAAPLLPTLHALFPVLPIGSLAQVQRTMLELLNQLDGFSSADDVKIIAATNRPDILDPALMRSGRLDRKIEFPHPNEEARAKILRIHSRKMNVSPDVNYDELGRSTDDFNAAQLKAVCVEAGMLALRRDATVVTHEDFNDAITEVQAKKKSNLQYYA